MGAGQGHGGDRLSLSLREKMYGYGCQYAIARLGETPRGVRLPTRRGGVGHPPSDQVSFFLLPFSFPGVRCASSSIPGVEQWGIGQVRNGVVSLAG